jgi:hypothetical protein
LNGLAGILEVLSTRSPPVIFSSLLPFGQISGSPLALRLVLPAGPH